MADALLERAAACIFLHAEELHRAHTIDGKWPQEDEHIKREWEDMRSLGRELIVRSRGAIVLDGGRQ